MITMAPTTRTRSQVKRLEFGSYVLNSEFNREARLTGTEGLAKVCNFIVSFPQERMEINLFDTCRIMWNFEQIRSVAFVKQTGHDGQTIEWLWITLTKIPSWIIKQDAQKKTRGRWGKAIDKTDPPHECEKLFQKLDGQEHNPYQLHIALHSKPELWQKYMRFLAQERKFPSLDDAQSPTALINSEMRNPFAEEDWSFAQDCANCDNQTTKASVFCRECKEPLCRACDIVLHKRSHKVSHVRATILPVPETIIEKRETVPPCACKRGTRCACERAAVYCALECHCMSINAFNYGPNPGHDDEGQDLVVATARKVYKHNASLPMRKAKMARRESHGHRQRDTGDDVANFVAQPKAADIRKKKTKKSTKDKSGSNKRIKEERDPDDMAEFLW